MKDKKELMKRIRDEVWNLKNSPLYAERIANKVYPVIGEGSHDAEIMFVGEAPGKNEALTGKPFCGASGKILDRLLDSIGIKRELVYVTNVVKDRPTNNRDPKLEEIELYAPFLDRQIEIISPKIIATLGRFSMDYIMKKLNLAEKLEPISKIHGQVFEGIFSDKKIFVIPLYHPAVSVYNANMFDSLKKDFESIAKTLKI